MAFASLDFIFDGIVGSTYGLQLMTLNDSGTDGASLGIDYEIIADRTNLTSNYVFGMQNNTPLSFELSVMSKTVIDRDMNRIICKWLFSHDTYKKLQILEDTVYGTYYLCKLKQAEYIKVGNQIYGYKISVICDCPYSHQFPSKTIKEKGVEDLIITINNTSDDNKIVHTKITIYPNKANGVVTILNETTDIASEITNLVNGEVITLDSKYCLIESDRVNLNYDRFNGHFVELNPKSNKLVISGDISKIEIEYEFLRIVGG